MNDRIEKILTCIGDIEDKWLEEAANIVFVPARIGKAAKISALAAAAASIGVTTALLIYRARNRRANMAAV